ncbi:MAG: TonB-dependent receptor [Gammaproteobacteria bacterium]|nr:TonB-dependent receptor [Gammaproteobacteria bacterium]
MTDSSTTSCASRKPARRASRPSRSSWTGRWGGIDFVAGVYRFEEDGANVQDPTVFLGVRGAFELAQQLDSAAVFASVGTEPGSRWQLAGGVRSTRDRKRATTDVGTEPVSAERRWRETSWEIAAHYALGDRMAAYATVQNGYQSGQFPARPYCLFVDPDCFTAGDNITALNYEIGVKGQPVDGLELSAAVFRTRCVDLPYQVSSTAGAGFSSVNLIVGQWTTGFESESTLYVMRRFRVHAALGWLNVKVEPQGGVRPVAPLTPELTLSLSPEYRCWLGNGSGITARLDYSYRSGMWGEPRSDPGRLTRVGGRGLVNFHVGYEASDGAWTVAVYGRNVLDRRYDNARLNTGDYLLRILSNDASEFVVRVERRF